MKKQLTRGRDGHRPWGAREHDRGVEAALESARAARDRGRTPRRHGRPSRTHCCIACAAATAQIFDGLGVGDLLADPSRRRSASRRRHASRYALTRENLGDLAQAGSMGMLPQQADGRDEIGPVDLERRIEESGDVVDPGEVEVDTAAAHEIARQRGRRVAHHPGRSGRRIVEESDVAAPRSSR